MKSSLGFLPMSPNVAWPPSGVHPIAMTMPYILDQELAWLGHLVAIIFSSSSSPNHLQKLE